MNGKVCQIKYSKNNPESKSSIKAVIKNTYFCLTTVHRTTTHVAKVYRSNYKVRHMSDTNDSKVQSLLTFGMHHVTWNLPFHCIGCQKWVRLTVGKVLSWRLEVFKETFWGPWWNQYEFFPESIWCFIELLCEILHRTSPWILAHQYKSQESSLYN